MHPLLLVPISHFPGLQVLSVGSVAYVGDSAFRVASAVAHAASESDGSPFRVVRSTRVVVSADPFTLPNDPAAGSASARGPVAPAPAGTSPAAEQLFGGSREALQSLRELVVWPMQYREMAAQLGVSFPRGILLHGPPGVRVRSRRAKWLTEPALLVRFAIVS